MAPPEENLESNIGGVDAPVVVVSEPNRTPLYLCLVDPLVIGRECEGLLVVDPLVSRRHLELDVVEGVVMVADLGSSNGTTLDGTVIGTPSQLALGSIARAGDMTIELVPDGATTPTAVFVTDRDGLRATVSASAAVAERPSRPRSFDDHPHQTSIEAIASSTTKQDLAKARMPLDQGTVTISFSDIEGSTQRNVELGDQVWLEVLGMHNDIIRRQLKRHGGTEIKNRGDGFMMCFQSARRALMCMIGVQQALAEHEQHNPQRSVRVRAGMHTGEVLEAEGDLFGTHVVIAARVADLAVGGEILVSSLSKEIVAARGDVVFGPAREVELKGIGRQLVHPVDWSNQLTD